MIDTAIIIALLAGAIGTYVLWSTFGPLTGILGLLSLFMYVALYTPMKRMSSWAVFVGAFPGAFPPMLGYVAATGTFGLGPGLLFAMQFMWQFPHFWSISWVLHDDYAKAGYHLLPSRGGRDRYSAFLVVLYTFEEGSGSTVTDVSGVGTPLNLTIQNPANVTWGNHSVKVDAATLPPGARFTTNQRGRLMRSP